MRKIAFAAVLENLEPMLDFIEQGAQELKFDARELNRIRLASEEALVNVINYAYPDKNGSVEIIYEIKDGKKLILEIIDSGVPFNPLSMPEPDIKSPMENRKIGGLGIFLVRSIMDELNYRREEGRNILTLTKYHCRDQVNEGK